MVTVTALPAVAVIVVGSNMKSLAARLIVAPPPPVADDPLASVFLLPPPPHPASTSPAVAAISTTVIHLRARIPGVRGQRRQRMIPQRTRKLDSPAGSSSETSTRSTSARRGPWRIH